MHLRRIPIISVVVLLVVVLVGVVLVAFSNADAARNGSSPPLNHPHIIFNDGMPANPSKGNSSLLTVADVEYYVNTHPFAGGPTVSHVLPKITLLQLVTSREASNLLGGEYIGLSDTAQVYYAVLYGPLVMENMHLPTGAKIPTVNLVDEVFDAHTGNLLVWGIHG